MNRHTFSPIRISEYTAAKNAAMVGQLKPARYEATKPTAAAPFAVSIALPRTGLPLGG
ncbi:MAG TPA: hypothetical protein VGD21_00845 [Lysobacter sp.]